MGRVGVPIAIEEDLSRQLEQVGRKRAKTLMSPLVMGLGKPGGQHGELLTDQRQHLSLGCGRRENTPQAAVHLRVVAEERSIRQIDAVYILLGGNRNQNGPH